MCRTVLRRFSLLAVITLYLAVPRPVVAQDSHYWAEQYGTRAALLGGAIIGSVRDVSAAYYNPGAAALNQEARFIISARTYRRGTMTLADGAGEGLDLETSTERPIPTILATPLRFGFLGRHVLLYSVLTRQQFDANVLAYRIEDQDILSVPGTESLAGAYDGVHNLRETWTGVTWAYPLTERFGIGVSQFLATRSYKITANALAQAATEAGDVGVAVRLRTRRLKHYRTLTKVGLSGEHGSFSYGVTATSPSISLNGSGLASYDASVAGVDTDGDGVEDPYLAASVQSNLPTTFRSGWAVGAGFGIQTGGTRLHVASEWFEAVDKFTAMDAEAFTPQTGGTPVDNDATVEFGSVLNWGVGLEHGVGGAMIFAGVASDQSAGVPEADRYTDLTLTNYDLLRFSGGASFRIARIDLMLGLGYARGSQPLPALFNLDRISVDPVPGNPTRLKYSQWTVVVGFELLPRDDGGEGDDGS